MVQEVPTFNTTRTTQIPSFDIVQQTGTRASASMFSGLAQEADRYADMQFTKMEAQMRRDMEREGTEVALQKGFDPNSVTDPQTVADEIYSKAALNTYGIQLQADIDNEINRLYLTNSKNAASFDAQAGEYISQTIESVPIELKPAVLKAATSNAQSKKLKIQLEQQRQALAESEKAETIRLETLAGQIITADTPEQKTLLVDQARNVISNSTQFITEEGKQAALMQFTNEVIFRDSLQKAATAEATPFEIIEDMDNLGIALTSVQLNQIYSAANQNINFENAQLARAERNQKLAINEIKNEVLMEAFEADESELGQAGFNHLYEQGIARLKAAGASVEELIDFKETASGVYFNVGTDNEAAITMIEDGLLKGDPDVVDRIQQFRDHGQITQATYQDLSIKAQAALADINKNPIVENYLVRDYVPNYAPHAMTPSAEVQALDMGNKDTRALVSRIANDKALLAEMHRKIVNLSAQGMNAQEIVDQLRADDRANKEPVKVSARIPASHPYSATPRLRAENLLAMEDLTVPIIGEKGKVTRANPEEYPFLKGPWTEQNKQARIKYLLAQQRRFEDIPEDKRPFIDLGYDRETLKVINDVQF